ncbi:LOW QUALITY PROTEIN: hypothetical protein CVT26_009612 [Gymnopilus dilepis]|uniref:Uncharacterized protein n=1 Tax=Gymnopilus dilepis TaxID=231916 RepID=A0A409YIJ8_9AGAR|nr:LOW QUALITY PROTEIN: hypothetical protein CVT26_009612 [Gymnopilus dilepis]
MPCKAVVLHCEEDFTFKNFNVDCSSDGTRVQDGGVPGVPETGLRQCGCTTAFSGARFGFSKNCEAASAARGAYTHVLRMEVDLRSLIPSLDMGIGGYIPDAADGLLQTMVSGMFVLQVVELLMAISSAAELLEK